MTVRKSHRGSIPAVRSLFVVVRLFLLSAFEGTPEIDDAFGNGHNGSLIERQSKCEAKTGTVQLKTDLRILLLRRRQARQRRSSWVRVPSLPRKRP